MNITIFLIVLLATSVFSYFIYPRIFKYEVSGNNQMLLFHFFFPLSRKYPRLIFVSVSALITVLFLLTKEITWYNLYLLFLLIVLQLVITIDIRSHRLPNVYVLPLSLTTLIATSIEKGFLITLDGMFFIFILLFAIGVLKLGSFGGGDLKFGLIIGAIVTASNTLNLIMVIAVAFLFTGIFLFTYMKSGLLNKKDFIPMGPFLYLGLLTYIFLEGIEIIIPLFQY